MGAWTSTFTTGLSNRSRTALSTVKSTLFQSTFNMITTTYNFSKSPPRHAMVIPAAGSYCLLREKDSNLRPLGYEPSELPLLYLAVWWRWRDSNPRLQKYK